MKMLMKKLFFTLISLCISFAIYAEKGSSLFSSFVEEMPVIKTLRQTTKPEFTFLADKEKKEREVKTEALKAKVQNGLPEIVDNQQGIIKKGYPGAKATAQRLDSIIAYQPDESNYTGQFVTYDDNYFIKSLRNCIWNEQTQSWDLFQEILYGWTDKGYQTLFQEVTHYEWGTEGSRKEWTYNESGKNDSYTYSVCFDMNMNWEYQEKQEYTFNEAGFQNGVLGYIWNGSDWEVSNKEEATLDQYGRQITFEAFYWNGNGWEGLARDEYEYDAAGHEVLKKMSFWNGQTGNWVYDMKFEREYDEEGNITLDLLGFWNTNKEDWSGSIWGAYTEKTEFTYDDNSREITQIYSILSNDVWVEKAQMYTVWTNLENGITQSVRSGYNEDIRPGGLPWQVLTFKYNQYNTVIYESEEINGTLRYEEFITFNEDNFETEILTLDYFNGMYINNLTTRDENNNPIAYKAHLASSANGPWELASEFEYTYENNYRTRAFAYYYAFATDNWGWGVDLDFLVPVSGLIQPEAARLLMTSYTTIK